MNSQDVMRVEYGPMKLKVNFSESSRHLRFKQGHPTEEDMQNIYEFMKGVKKPKTINENN